MVKRTTLFFTVYFRMNPENKVVISAHDAGAANHILAWLSAGDIVAKNIECFFSGPAAELALQQAINSSSKVLTEQIKQCDLLICGTGWMTDTEKCSLELGLQQGKKVVAVFDHWTNFDKRLLHRGEMLKPSEVWVTDEYAKALAEDLLPEINIVQQENRYLKNLLKDIRFEESGHHELNVLFVMEPVREKYDNDDSPGEFQAFHYLTSQLKFLTDKKVRIIIRPHPSDPADKYRELESERQDIAVTVNTTQSLSEQITDADWVVGLQSYAMVIALAAGKRVISCIPPGGPACILPHLEIEHLRELIS